MPYRVKYRQSSLAFKAIIKDISCSVFQVRRSLKVVTSQMAYNRAFLLTMPLKCKWQLIRTRFSLLFTMSYHGKWETQISSEVWVASAQRSHCILGKMKQSKNIFFYRFYTCTFYSSFINWGNKCIHVQNANYLHRINQERITNRVHSRNTSVNFKFIFRITRFVMHFLWIPVTDLC